MVPKTTLLPADLTARHRPLPAVRRSARGAAGVALAVFGLGLAAAGTQAEAKSPGGVHCYKRICHRILTLEETSALTGRTLRVATSYYDHSSADRFNRGTFTSNGERFRADDPGRAASSEFPDGTELVLRNPANGRVSHVRINDFGPFRGNRRLDVTRRVAVDLGFTKAGVTELEVTVIAPPGPEDTTYRRNRAGQRARGALGVLDEKATAALVTLLIAERAPAATPAAVAEVAMPVAEIVTASAEEAAPPASDRPNAAEAQEAVAIAPAGIEAAAEAGPGNVMETETPTDAVVPVAPATSVALTSPDKAEAGAPAGIAAIVEAPQFPAAVASATLREAATLQGDVPALPSLSQAALLSVMSVLTGFLLWSAVRSERERLVSGRAAATGWDNALSDEIAPLAAPSFAQRRARFVIRGTNAADLEPARRPAAKIELQQIAFRRGSLPPPDQPPT